MGIYTFWLCRCRSSLTTTMGDLLGHLHMAALKLYWVMMKWVTVAHWSFESSWFMGVIMARAVCQRYLSVTAVCRLTSLLISSWTAQCLKGMAMALDCIDFVSKAAPLSWMSMVMGPRP